MYINVSIHYPYVTHCIASGRWQQEHATVRYGHSCSWTMQQNFRWSIILKRSMSSNSSGMRWGLHFETLRWFLHWFLMFWLSGSAKPCARTNIRNGAWHINRFPLCHPEKIRQCSSHQNPCIYTVRFRSACACDCACDKQNLWLIKGQCSMPITRARWLQLSWHGKPVRGFVQSQSRLQYLLDHMHGESNILQRNYLQWLWF